MKGREVKFIGVQDDAAIVARDQVHGRSELSYQSPCTRQSGLDSVSRMGRHVHSSSRIVAFFSSIRLRRSGSVVPNGMAGIAQSSSRRPAKRMVSRKRWNSHDNTIAWGQVVANALTIAQEIRTTTAMSTKMDVMGPVSLGGVMIGGGNMSCYWEMSFQCLITPATMKVLVIM